MVKKYTWNDSIATGDTIIDLQHKQFFAVLYDFAEALERNEGAKELRKVTIFLKYYAEWHFGKEEDSVACYNCPLAGKNVDAHKQYMVTVNDVLEKIRETGVSEEMAHATYEKLTDWLVNHIMKIDQANADCMKEARASAES